MSLELLDPERGIFSRSNQPEDLAYDRESTFRSTIWRSCQRQEGRSHFRSKGQAPCDRPGEPGRDSKKTPTEGRPMGRFVLYPIMDPEWQVLQEKGSQNDSEAMNP